LLTVAMTRSLYRRGETHGRSRGVKRNHTILADCRHDPQSYWYG